MTVRRTNVCHTWLCGRSRRQKDFQIRHVRETDGRRSFRWQTWRRSGADFGPAAIDYTTDVPFSEEIFTRLGDTYRRIRNTLRILLGNLYDFPVAGVADLGGPASSMPATTLIDRWILERLDGGGSRRVGLRTRISNFTRSITR